MLFKKDELRLLWPFYLTKLLLGLSVVVTPFLIIYFQDKGYSFFQIELMAAVVFFAVFLFEVPTGAIADLYGRKISVFFGYLTLGVTSFLIAFFDTYLIIMVLWVFYGIGLTMISGAEDALVVDAVHEGRGDIAYVHRGEPGIGTGQREERRHRQQLGEAIEEAVITAKDHRWSKAGYEQTLLCSRVDQIFRLTLGFQVLAVLFSGIGIQRAHMKQATCIRGQHCLDNGTG